MEKKDHPLNLLGDFLSCAISWGTQLNIGSELLFIWLLKVIGCVAFLRTVSNLEVVPEAENTVEINSPAEERLFIDRLRVVYTWCLFCVLALHRNWKIKIFLQLHLLLSILLLPLPSLPHQSQQPKRKKRNDCWWCSHSIVKSTIKRRAMRDKREAEKSLPELNYEMEVAKTLSALPPWKRALAKVNIQQLLYEIEFPKFPKWWLLIMYKIEFMMVGACIE